MQRFSARFAESKTARGALVAIAIKISASFLNFVMLTLAARLMGAVEFGHFAIWFNVVSFLAIIALCGQETLIVRSWGEYIQQRRYDLARGALTFGLMVSFSAAVAVACGLTVVSQAMKWGTSPAVIVAACLFLITETQRLFISISTRSIAGIVAGEGQGEVTWRVLVIVGVLAAVAFDVQLTTATFFFVAAAAAGPIMLLQTALILRSVPPEVKAIAPARDVAAWSRRSLPMWSGAFLNAAAQYLEVILIGLLLSPVAAGGYFVAARIANAFAMIEGGMASYSASTIASLFFGGRHDDLRQALRTIALATVMLVVAGLIVVLAGGDLLLAIFGPTYVDQYAILVLLSIGTALAALGGPAMHVLLLTGREGLYSRIVVVGLIARFFALVVFTPLFGAIAAAVAWTASTIAMTIALNMACRRLVGVDPSIMALLTRRSLGPHEPQSRAATSQSS